LKCCDTLDRWTASWAKQATLALAFLAAIVSLFDGDDMSLLTVILTNILVFWLWLRLVAWLGRLTDGDGSWSAQACLNDVRGRLGAAGDELRELVVGRGLTRAWVLAYYLSQLGVASILAGNWLRIIDVARTLSTSKSDL